jgi:hypothetical protein
MSRIGAIIRWSTWAASLSSRHRRLIARAAGLSAVLVKPRSAGRAVRELWTVSMRRLLPQIHLAIQPLLRFDLRRSAAASPVLHQSFFTQTSSRFDLSPAAAAPQILHQMTRMTHYAAAERRSSETQRIVERFRQTDSSTVHVFEPAPERAAPLSLVLQRLREPERVLAARRNRPVASVAGTTARPAAALHLADKVRRAERPVEPVARVLRQEALEPRSDRALSAAAHERIPDSWRGMPAGVPIAAPAVPSLNVEALTETVMHQIDQRLHAWRERRGGF